jgi:ribosomal protein L11
VHRQQVKQKDYHLSHIPLQGICRMVHGTCGTMGIKVEGLREAKPLEDKYL